MGADLFLDSNILVYAYDTHKPEKQKRAQALLKTAIQEESRFFQRRSWASFLLS